MEHLSWFIFDFLVVFSIYYFMVIRKARRGKKVPSEVSFLINCYKLDTKKFNYKKFLVSVGLVTSFDVAFVATIIPMFRGLLFQILFGIIIIVPVVVLSFYLLGKYYQYKQEQDNSEELKQEKRRNKKGKKKNVK